MLSSLTPEFRAKVMERYMFKDPGDGTPIVNRFPVENEDYETDQSSQSYPDSDSDMEDQVDCLDMTEPDMSMGRQIRSLITYTLPDKSTYVVMVKEQNRWMFPVWNFTKNVRNTATETAQLKLQLEIQQDSWTIVGGGETAL